MKTKFIVFTEYADASGTDDVIRRRLLLYADFRQVLTLTNLLASGLFPVRTKLFIVLQLSQQSITLTPH